MFPVWNVPVAYSMVALANNAALKNRELFQSYMCYWSAFNNIYVTLAEQNGKGPELDFDKQGNMKIKWVGEIDMPNPKVLPEKMQIALAFSKFSPELKHVLVVHPSTEFFVYRTPSWHKEKIEQDAQGRRLNGVLNVGYTVDAEHPVWTPISQEHFEQQKTNPSVSNIDVLAKQVLDVLYTVRNNTFHGGKRVDDANDREVIEHAFPLLKEVVDFFLQDKEYLV